MTIKDEYKLAVGLFDLPSEAKHGVAYIYPMKNNTAVFGSAMTGKTTFIKTLLIRLCERQQLLPNEEVYILDFGGNIGRYSNLNIVCGCFDGTNAEDVKRLFKTVDEHLKANILALNNSSYYSLLADSPEKCPPHITLIVDNVNSMLSNEMYENYMEKLLVYSRDGLSKGLSVVITANNTSHLGRLISNFSQKIAFSLSDDEYSEIFNTRVKALPKKNPGRGFINIDSKICEFQGFLPFEHEDAELDEIIKKQEPQLNTHKLISFPNTAITEKNISEYAVATDKPQSSDAIPIVVGLDYYTHNTVYIDISLQRCFAIYGKREFGKSNLLKQLVKGIRKSENIIGKIRFVCLDDGRKQLEDNELCELFPMNQSNDDAVRYLEKFSHLKAFNDYLCADYGGFRDSESDMQRSVGGRGTMPLSPQMPGLLSEPNPDNPFTVFILQSKAIYQNNSQATRFAKWYNRIMTDAVSYNCLFIFSDVKPIAKGTALDEAFNNSISVMFLLDNIAEFVSGRGQSTVIASYMEYKELKAEYAACSLGDGYFYEVDADNLQKLKYIKYETGGNT